MIPRRVFSFGFLLLGLFLLVTGVRLLRLPALSWTRARPVPFRWATPSSSAGAVVTLEELAGLGRRLPKSGARTAMPSAPATGAEPFDLPGILGKMHASIRAEEEAQAEAAVRRMESYLEARVAERLAAREAAWQEDLERRRIELTEEDGRLLAAYAAQIRREALPELGALEMALAFCNDEKRRAALEEELTRATAAVEGKISKREEELEKARERSLEELRREAQEDLDRLAADLRAEARAVLADYRTRAGKALSAWLAEDFRAEGVLLRNWGF